MGLPALQPLVDNLMRRARVPTLGVAGACLSLPSDTAHYLGTVLRLPVGTTLELFDGAGHQALAELLSDGQVRLLNDPTPAAAPAPLHLLIGVLKGSAMDDAVRAATEAGMTHLHAIATRHAVPTRPRLDRWERVVEAAARQCGRADVPELAWHERLEHAFAATHHLPVRRVGVRDAPRREASSDPAAVLIGPEGGLHSTELLAAYEAGFEPTALGHWTLRACTAAPIALALTRA